MNRAPHAALLAALVFLPPAAWSARGTVWCQTPHWVRLGGTEVRTTAIGFSNADLRHSVTIERITIRDVFGEVVHDSRPAIGVPHPEAGGFLDITEIPPGASYFLLTRDISGLGPVEGNNQRGSNMAIEVAFSKAGSRHLFRVSSKSRIRERIQNPDGSFTEGEERVRDGQLCFAVRRGKKDDGDD